MVESWFFFLDQNGSADQKSWNSCSTNYYISSLLNIYMSSPHHSVCSTLCRYSFQHYSLGKEVVCVTKPGYHWASLFYCSCSHNPSHLDSISTMSWMFFPYSLYDNAVMPALLQKLNHCFVDKLLHALATVSTLTYSIAYPLLSFPTNLQ